jgi:SAM-dependent methyltransferase
VPFELSDLDPRTRASIEAYDDVAADYQLQLRTHRPQTDVKRFARDLTRGTVVLDAGCGPANDIRLLRDRGLHVIGLDMSEGALDHARLLLPRDGLVRGPLEDQPFADDSFGGLWCNGGLDHTPRDRWRAVFTALVRTLEQGPVMLSCYRGTVDMVEVTDDLLGTIHVSAITEDEAVTMFEERGLVDIRVEVRPDPLHGRRRPNLVVHARKPAA